jgi:hypothetical protein
MGDRLNLASIICSNRAVLHNALEAFQQVIYMLLQGERNETTFIAHISQIKCNMIHGRQKSYTCSYRRTSQTSLPEIFTLNR